MNAGPIKSGVRRSRMPRLPPDSAGDSLAAGLIALSLV